MTRTAIHTDDAPKAIGPYSQAIRAGEFGEIRKHAWFPANADDSPLQIQGDTIAAAFVTRALASRKDVAAVASIALREGPEKHGGQGYWLSTEVLSGPKVAAILTDLKLDVPTIVSYVSEFVTLVPGDVIFTGTPGQTKPMAPGDTIEIEVEGVGVLRNKIAD